jgi:acyl-homoserine lactone synthase
MVWLVTDADRHYFNNQLEAMYRDRKRVFVDRLGWNVPVVNGEYEIDQFDTPDAYYLLDLDADGQHLGSIRLLPTTKPHIFGTLFPQLCESPIPVGDTVWEITRLCTTPGLMRGESRRIRNQLGAAALEFGLINGISQYTIVASKCWLSHFLTMGWDCRPLGAPREINGEVLGALIVDVSPKSLQSLRIKTGVRRLLLKTGYLARAA